MLPGNSANATKVYFQNSKTSFASHQNQIEKLRKGCTQKKRGGRVRPQKNCKTLYPLLNSRTEYLIVEHISFLQRCSLFDPYTLHFKRGFKSLLEKEEACWDDQKLSCPITVSCTGYMFCIFYFTIMQSKDIAEMHMD